MSVQVRGGKSGEPPSSLIYFGQSLSHGAQTAYTGAPLVALSLSGNKRPPIGHAQSFLCSCMLPHGVASNAHSLPVLRFILALAACINRREHLAEWHHEMGTSCSAKYHRELFIRGINLLFHVCFVVGLCCIFKFVLFPVSSQGT